MELRQVRSFLKLVEEGTFRRAAEKLHIVQPALSQQIHALEEELGCELFLRTSRGAQLTIAGQAFREEAEAMMIHAKRAHEAVQRASRGQVGTVRIGFSASAAIGGRLAADLDRFHRRYPQVAVELQEMYVTQQVAAIEEGRIDIGYGRLDPPVTLANMRSDVLLQFTWVVALGSGHPLAAETVLRLEDLHGQEFIVFGENGENGEKAGQIVTLQAMLAGEPTYMYQLNEALAVLTLVAAGMGIALAPEPMSNVALPNLVFKPIADYAETMTLELLSRADERLTAISNYRSLVLNAEV